MGQTHGLDPRAGPDGAVAAAWLLPTSWGAGGTVIARVAAGDVLTGPARGPQRTFVRLEFSALLRTAAA